MKQSAHYLTAEYGDVLIMGVVVSRWSNPAVLAPQKVLLVSTAALKSTQEYRPIAYSKPLEKNKTH